MGFTDDEDRCCILGIGGAGGMVAGKLAKKGYLKNSYVLDVDDSLFQAGSFLNYVKIGNIIFPLDPKERLKMTVSEEMIRDCLLKSRAEVDLLLDKLSDYFIILTGLAGRTSSILLPYILEQVKEKNKTVLVLIWSPLYFEGELRKRRFSDALNKVVSMADYIFIQNNHSIATRNREASLSTLYEIQDGMIIWQIESMQKYLR